MSGYLRKMVRNKMRSKHSVFKRTVREHEDLLEDIETLFVTAARTTGLVDDAACHDAIEALLTGRAPRSPIAALLVDKLCRRRKMRADASENAWQDALRVVAASIRNHSARLPGQVDYLLFIGFFIP